MEYEVDDLLIEKLKTQQKMEPDRRLFVSDGSESDWANPVLIPPVWSE